jgi:thioredoxin reductase (NADPH)
MTTKIFSITRTYDVAIIGAGPTGLFAVFQLGLLGLNAALIDTLDKVGGQCAELYPEKPIYDIPAWPEISGQELTDKLVEQIKPFEPDYYLGQQVTTLAKDDNGRFLLETSEGLILHAGAVFIAAGAGSFTPRKPRLDGLEAFEEQSLFYAVKDRSKFVGHDVVIAGGGDSALDWTLNLIDDVRSLTLIHRRAKFRGHPASAEAVKQLIADGRIRFVEGQLASLEGNQGQLEQLSVKTKSGLENVVASRLLSFFGLNIELGPIKDWTLDLEGGKQVRVDTEKFETSTPGIFAIGDINHYPGKLKLILSGFHECALAAQAAFKYIRPDEKLHFQYTTSSSELQKRLQVA